MFRENVQGGVPGVPDHPASVRTPGVGVLLAELGLVVPSATCQLPESGATLIMCLSLDKCLAYRIFKNSSLCLKRFVVEISHPMEKGAKYNFLNQICMYL